MKDQDMNDSNVTNNNRVKLFKNKSRGGKWYIRQWIDGKPKDISLGTTDEQEARELADVKHSILKLDKSHAAEMAKIYQAKAGADYVERTWDYCFKDFNDPKTKSESSVYTYKSHWHNPVFDSIRDKTIADTDPTDLSHILKTATASGRALMLMLHSHAMQSNWMFAPLLTKNIKDSTKRKLGDSTATLEEEEYHKIIKAIDGVIAKPSRSSLKHAVEFKDYITLLWHVGGSSSDMASLTTANVDWNQEPPCLVYYREKHRGTKTGMGEKKREPVDFPMGKVLKALVLKRMNIAGAEGHKQLFPLMNATSHTHRLKILNRYLKKADISKKKVERDGKVRTIKMHSFRYAVAKRMAECRSVTMREAQYYLGHSCEAVARYYAGRAAAKLQPLEVLEAKYKAVKEAETLAA